MALAWYQSIPRFPIANGVSVSHSTITHEADSYP